MGNEKFEYLPQLIVANDGNKIPNLIHITGAKNDEHYYCPCCGGEVRPRAINSEKEQAHYYHINGTCSKESQLYFFCKNWLFDAGSKFYLGGTSYEVVSSEIKKSWPTPFGDYIPDVSVSTVQGQTIFFEMFFNNRKTDSDYFCQWQYLNNPVVEVDLRHYMMKTSTNEIPAFDYLYFNGECFCRPYVERDVYARTIGRSKNFLSKEATLENKIRIEKLDKFWEVVKKRLEYDNASIFKTAVISVIGEMSYEDQLLCLKIIKGKQCLLFIKQDVLNVIYENMVQNFLSTLKLDYWTDKSIYPVWKFARTRLHLGWGTVIANDYCHFVYSNTTNEYCSCDVNTRNEMHLSPSHYSDYFNQSFEREYNSVCKAKNVILSLYSKLHELELLDSNFKFYISDRLRVLYRNIEIYNYSLDTCSYECEHPEIFISKLNKKIDNIKNYPAYQARATELSQEYNCQIQAQYFFYEYQGRQYSFDEKVLLEDLEQRRLDLFLTERVNNCSNHFWSLKQQDNGTAYILDQKIFQPKRWSTYVYIYAPLTEEKLLEAMHRVFKNMEYYGYRIMEA